VPTTIDCDDWPTDVPDLVAQDAKDQRVVLAFLLEERPTRLTISEVAQALYANPDDFKTGDAVERAVRELVGVELLYCRGRFVRPTRAALHFARLELP
jgi:hypothetical protein